MIPIYHPNHSAAYIFCLVFGIFWYWYSIDIIVHICIQVDTHNIKVQIDERKLCWKSKIFCQLFRKMAFSGASRKCPEFTVNAPQLCNKNQYDNDSMWSSPHCQPSLDWKLWCKLFSRNSSQLFVCSFLHILHCSHRTAIFGLLYWWPFNEKRENKTVIQHKECYMRWNEFLTY